MKVKSLSRIRLLATPWTAAYQAPPSMDFPGKSTGVGCQCLGNQSRIFTWRTDAEAETPILWPPDVKNRFIGKDPNAGNDCRREEKGTTEDEMVGWYHRLDAHDFE